jgi:DNA-binding response OmpR family regulator
MFEGIAEGVPVLAQVEVGTRAEPMSHEGREGHLHFVQVRFLRREDERKLDVWLRAAEVARRGTRDGPARVRPSARIQAGAPVTAPPRAVPEQARPTPAPPQKGPDRVAPAPAAGPAPSPRPRLVLLVGEERARARELKQALADSDSSLELEPLASLAALRRRLAAVRPCLVLLAPDLPDARGLDCLRAAVALSGGVPVVVLAHGGEPDGFEVGCLLAGAARVLRRGGLAGDLARRVRDAQGWSEHVEAPPEPRSAGSAAAAPGTPASAPRPVAAPPPPPPRSGSAAPEALVAELWWHEEGLAAIWCAEPLRLGLSCELRLDLEGRGRPEPHLVEIVRVHHKCAPDGRNGYLHEAVVRHPIESTPASTPEPPSRPPHPAPRSDALFRVVLVEHNPGLTPSALRAELGRIEGLLIETRGSLAGLRARARRGGMDLVFLELDLPDSQGLDTVRAALAAVGAVPVVAVVAEPSGALGAECAALGVARVVAKGLDHRQALALITALRG